MQKFDRIIAERTLKETFKSLCNYANTPYSLGLWLGVKHEGLNFLSRQTFRHSDYDNSFSFSNDYLVYSFGRKLKSMSLDPSLKTEALRSFIRAELRCKKYNELFRSGRTGHFEALIFNAQCFIGRLLPDVSKCFDYTRCRFGPGSTYTLSGEKSSWDKKIREDLFSVTADSFGLARKLLSSDPHLFEARHGILPEGPFSLMKNSFRLIEGSKLITVPKSSKTDRPICVEPSVNVMLQKGAGAAIASALLKKGIDLRDQSNNQKLASRAQHDKLATIDLESASDTLCHGLVLDLLPPDWFVYLDALRSKSYMIDNQWRSFEKFSAMGNGFTFELESLIFYALACAIVPSDEHKNVSVFGDDIIVPQKYAPELLELLEYVGFLPNREKTFISGRFFESCGKHYFDGFDVTPIYQKEIPYDESEIYRLANRIYRWTRRQFGCGPDDIGCPVALRRAWLNAWRAVKLPIFIPIIEDDIGLISNKKLVDLLVCKKKVDYLKGLIPFPRKIRVGDHEALAYTLRFKPGEPVTGLLSLRSRPRYRYGLRRFWTQFYY